MKHMNLIFAATFGIAALGGQALAAGCVSGAAVGAVAGHVAHHHAILGAAAGCVAGHEINKHEKEKAAQAQQANQPAQ